MSKTSEIKIVKSMKLLVAQSENLDRLALVEKSINNMEASNMYKGKSAGICHAVNELKSKIEFMQSEIRLKKKVMIFLFGCLLASLFFNFMQFKKVKILQDYNEQAEIEQVDYNSFQD